MTWLQRYQVNGFLGYSVWFPPLIGIVAALLMHPLIHGLDVMLGWKAVVGPDSARAVLGALASSMLTFIVFVFSILLVAVQLASARLTPRIIAIVCRNRVVNVSLTIFVVAFTYTLAALSRIEDSVPRMSLWVAVYSSVACIGVILFMIDRVGKSLRPVSIPDWEDFGSMAITEISQFGRDSIQIVRRMRALLENLIEVAPPQRAAPLRA
jgi:uncharacterized membrane protein